MKSRRLDFSELEDIEDPDCQVKTTRQSVKMVCTLKAYVEFLLEVKKWIPTESWRIIERTDFWPLISAIKDGLVKKKMLVKQQRDFEEIMAYYEYDGVFNFGGVVVDMRATQVSELFGLRNTGELHVSLGGLHNRVGKAEEVFPEIVRAVGPTRSDIKKRLVDELKKPRRKEKGNNKRKATVEYQDDELIASLILMDLLSTFLFPRCGTFLSWDLVQRCIDIPTINMYNWARSTLVFLVRSLNEHDRAKPKHINGCTLFVQYWFLEVSKMQQQKYKRQYEGRPGFLKWKIREMFDLEECDLNPNLLVVIHRYALELFVLFLWFFLT